MQAHEVSGVAEDARCAAVAEGIASGRVWPSDAEVQVSANGMMSGLTVVPHFLSAVSPDQFWG